MDRGNWLQSMGLQRVGHRHRLVSSKSLACSKFSVKCTVVYVYILLISNAYFIDISILTPIMLNQCSVNPTEPTCIFNM